MLGWRTSAVRSFQSTESLSGTTHLSNLKSYNSLIMHTNVIRWCVRLRASSTKTEGHSPHASIHARTASRLLKQTCCRSVLCTESRNPDLLPQGKSFANCGVHEILRQVVGVMEGNLFLYPNDWWLRILENIMETECWEGVGVCVKWW